MVNEVAGITFRADSRDVRGATKDLDRMSDSAARGERAGKRMARTLKSAFAGLGVGLIIRQIINNTIEQERATAQLEATLRSTGRYTPQLSKAMQDYAAQLQDLTTFSDETIITAQSQLATFTKLGAEVFPRATEAALDLATKMGGDLKGAVVQIGKALQDPVKGVTALSEVGVNFSASQRKVIQALVETNRLAEAQSLILDELETEFGGSAEAARDTFGGALTALKNTINDLITGRGEGLRGATDAVNELNEAMSDPGFQQGADNITTALLRIGGGAAEALTELGNLGQQIGFGFAQLTGNVSDADILEQQLREVERALGGTIFSRPLRFLTTSREELERLREGLQEAIEQARFDELGFARPTGERRPDLSGLGEGARDPIEPIVVDAKEARDTIGRLLQEISRDGNRAAEDLTNTLNRLAAQMGGPSVAAAVDLSETMSMLDRQQQALAAAGKLDAEAQAQLASARALATQQYRDQIEAIREEEEARAAQLTPVEQLIADLEFERELMALSNEEREVEIALRHAGADATAAQVAKIRELITASQQEREAIALMDTVRRSATDSLADFVGGFSSAEDAVDDFVQHLRRIAAQIIAERLIESILGPFGSTGGVTVGAGGSGGIGSAILSIFSSLFGGGRALGGPVQPGRLHPIAERGEPELLTVGRRQYLIPGPEGGQVQPINQTTDNRRNTYVNHVTITQPIRRETASQIAADIQREQRVAVARNR